VPEGVWRLTEEQARRREPTYKFYSRKGRVEKIEALDHRGRLTVHHEMTGLLGQLLGRASERRSLGTPRGECSWEYERDAQGNVVKEVARDPAGRVVWTFHFSIRTHGYFTDEHGFPRPVAGSGAAYVEFVWSADGLEKERHYLDRNRKHRADPNGLYGRRMEHDARGFVTSVTHLGIQDRPMLHPNGYAKLTRRRDERGLLVETAYFGLDGKPALNKDQAMARELRAYDDHGRLTELRAFGLDGKPTLNRSSGVAAILFTYDEQDNLQAFSTLGVDGKPARDLVGVARYVYAYDDRGNSTAMTCLGVDGQPVTRADRTGFAKVTSAHDEHGNEIEVAYFGPDGKPTRLGRSGDAVREKLTYNQYGEVVERSLFGADGRPAADAAGVARYDYGYDQRGNCTEQSYFGPDGQPVLLRYWAFARITQAFDEHRNLLEVAFFGTDGKPLVPATWTTSMPPLARFVAVPNDTPTPRYLVSKVTHAYDDRGNRTETAYWATDGKPTEGLGGNAKIKRTYDEHGYCTDRARFDVEGKPTTGNGEVFRTAWRYDGQGRLTEVATVGADGKPAAGRNGVARSTRAYDDRGNVTAEAFFGADDQPTHGRFGYCRAVFTYDAENRLTGSTYLDRAGTPVRTQVVYNGERRQLLGGGGFRAGDVLVSYDGKELRCARALLRLKRQEPRAAEPKELRILRDGQPLTLRVPTGPIPGLGGFAAPPLGVPPTTSPGRLEQGSDLETWAVPVNTDS
jgi:hypothetical protein